MSRLFTGIVLGVLLLFTGCGQSVVEPLPPKEVPGGVPEQEQPEEGVVVTLPIEEEEYTLSVVPRFEESESPNTMAYRPAFFEISGGGMQVGSIVDTWTKDGYFTIAGACIEYKKGEPMFFLLYNGSDTATDFGISVENAPLEVNYLRSGSWPDVPVYRVPEEFLNQVVLPKNITVQPDSICKVPFGFVVPRLPEDYPENWEFRIRLSDPKNRVGNVVIEYTLRVVAYGG